MLTFWLQSNKVPKVVVRALPSRNFVIRFRFDCMNEIWEFYCFLNEEDGHVVADNIPVSFLRVELDRESTDVSDCILFERK